MTGHRRQPSPAAPDPAPSGARAALTVLAALPETGRAGHEGVHLREVRAAGDASDGGVVKPAPDAGEVLVKVLAISVNAVDWHSMRGKPLFSRASRRVAAAENIRSSASRLPGR